MTKIISIKNNIKEGTIIIASIGLDRLSWYTAVPLLFEG